MTNKFCVLFDMDGVVLDTEIQYNVIWKQIGDKYNAGIENFEYVIKGTTLPNILDKYFSHLSANERQSLINDLMEFEDKMDYRREVKGAGAFINELKRNGIKVGLVTSSNNDKMASVYKQNDLRKTFDTMITANRIVKGKPDPMCFLLAAEDLGYKPQDCFVFEDSFAGIEAGNRADMIVVGVATTHPAESLQDKCKKVIPDFSNFSYADLEKLYLSES